MTFQGLLLRHQLASMPGCLVDQQVSLSIMGERIHRMAASSTTFDMIVKHLVISHTTFSLQTQVPTQNPCSFFWTSWAEMVTNRALYTPLLGSEFPLQLLVDIFIQQSQMKVHIFILRVQTPFSYIKALVFSALVSAKYSDIWKLVFSNGL
jgi:hypothetical protein